MSGFIELERAFPDSYAELIARLKYHSSELLGEPICVSYSEINGWYKIRIAHSAATGASEEDPEPVKVTHVVSYDSSEEVLRYEQSEYQRYPHVKNPEQYKRVVEARVLETYPNPDVS